MSDWSQDRLQALILLPQEEDTRHEYKSAESLRFSEENRKSEFRKDVSSMANSAGGTIVYGMVERKDGSRVIPDHLESVDSIGTTKDTLYQVLDSVQRRIGGVKIETVDLISSGYVYVVEIPESNTIHMCEGGSLKYAGKYFTRRGNRVSVMEDHEVRMGLNRSVHPFLEPTFTLWNISHNGKRKVLNGGRQDISNYEGGPRITVTVQHSGGPLAEKIQLQLDCPCWLVDSNGERWIWSWSNYNTNAHSYASLFPEQHLEFDLVVRKDLIKFAPVFGLTASALPDIEKSKIKWTLWADSAPPRRGEIKIDTIQRRQD